MQKVVGSKPISRFLRTGSDTASNGVSWVLPAAGQVRSGQVKMPRWRGRSQQRADSSLGNSRPFVEKAGWVDRRALARPPWRREQVRDGIHETALPPVVGVDDAALVLECHRRLVDRVVTRPCREACPVRIAAL